MNLHLDKDAFKMLIENIHQRTGYRTDVLEKDYYVVLILKELSQKQFDESLPAYFKGGTALYKALKTTNRFSEDIDLSVDTRNLSRSQNKKLLDEATKKYISLKRKVENSITNRSEVIVEYDYVPLTSYDANDMLQRFGRLKVEATSFTISEPYSELTVSAMIYDLATDNERKILENNYNVYPFDVKTITLERIFVDKLFAAETYVRQSDVKNKAFEASKHIYDLAVLENHPQIISLMKNEGDMEYLISIRLEEEKSRLGGIPNLMPSEFILFTEARFDYKIRQAYDIMQKQYVLRSKDRINFDSAMDSLARMNMKLKENPAWSNYYLESDLDEADMNNPGSEMKFM